MYIVLLIHFFWSRDGLKMSSITPRSRHLNAIECPGIWFLRGSADKSLARPTSRCRRTESIVSLERGVCSCAELQVLSVTEAERKHVRRRARFQQH